MLAARSFGSLNRTRLFCCRWVENSYRYVGEADENGKLVVAHKPTSLVKSAMGWKVPTAAERTALEAADQASAEAACAKLRKPFDALDPNFTGIAEK